MIKRMLGVLIATALAAGCGPRAETPKAEATPEAPRVALVLKTLNSPFFIDMEKGAQEAAKRLGVNLTVQAAEREVDVDKQMQIIENLIQTGIKVLLVTPSGSKEIAPAIAKANKAGIRVVVVDTRVDPQAAKDAGITIDSYIGSDNYEGGRWPAAISCRPRGARPTSACWKGFPVTRRGTSACAGSRTR
jgi:ribose transport system substrate-binding protein